MIQVESFYNQAYKITSATSHTKPSLVCYLLLPVKQCELTGKYKSTLYIW